jgi:DNA invertase Pin-like site-specific DNA recombinase
MNPKLTPDRLRRRAIVYIRQSTPGQLIHNQESKRRQYGLVNQARELGFPEVIVIDDDLGRSGSGLVERPGFQRLVAEVCTGEVGAVFCIEASRLARNGRDWHHLIELCGMVDAVVVDPDGVYDPGIINDRLLLGLKGTMSEFELNLLRQRSAEAIRAKACRGELQHLLPIGFRWSADGKTEKDPDHRVQQAIQLVFRKMTELGSVRQVLMWFREENVSLPAYARDRVKSGIVWKVPVYHSILGILTNPIYAGAYAYGKTEMRIAIVNGRARKTAGHHKERHAWMVLIREHHLGYVSWEEYERNQAMIAANTYMRSGMEPKTGRGGRGLLAGILRCRRCGRMLHVNYSGLRGVVLRYECHATHILRRCISFGGLRIDQAVANEVLGTISGNAVEAALEAVEQIHHQRQAQRQAFELELEQARYEARLAARRYDAVDPDQRLVAAELEARWNAALQKVRELEDKLQEFDLGIKSVPMPHKEVLLSLAQDLPAVWNSPSTDMRLKQRIVHILIQEIVADVDDEDGEIVLLIHWAGGRHSELRVKKSGIGRHRWCTSIEAIDIIRQMAARFPDKQIATTLNRLRLKTGTGNTWNDKRVRSARYNNQLPIFDLSDYKNSTVITLQEAAERLKVSPTCVRRMIAQKQLPASQVIRFAPWEIPVEALESEVVRKAITNIKNRVRNNPQTQDASEQQPIFSESY